MSQLEWPPKSALPSACIPAQELLMCSCSLRSGASAPWRLGLLALVQEVSMCPIEMWLPLDRRDNHHDPHGRVFGQSSKLFDSAILFDANYSLGGRIRPTRPITVHNTQYSTLFAVIRRATQAGCMVAPHPSTGLPRGKPLNTVKRSHYSDA